MFCDEPTSSLSGSDALLVIKTLLTISKRWNTTIPVVIHQPRYEIVQCFDRLLLMTARPGRIVYDGAMIDAPAYFAAVGFQPPLGGNPADFYLDCVTPGNGADERVAAFVAHYENQVRPKVERMVNAAIAK